MGKPNTPARRTRPSGKMSTRTALQRPRLLEMRTVTLSSKGQIALPQHLRSRHRLGAGAKLIVLAYEDRIELRPAKLLDEFVKFSDDARIASLMSAPSLAKAWLSREDEEAWKDL
jgi:AbrB family looped-hinge helix DNA binding protein